MKTRAAILKNAEAFVRDVMERDFKQKIDPETLREAAEKAASAIPTPRAKSADPSGVVEVARAFSPAWPPMLDWTRPLTDAELRQATD